MTIRFVKFLPSPTARKFELELFKFCKLNEEAQTANAGVLLWELEKMGITREDARLKPIIQTLRRLRRFFVVAALKAKPLQGFCPE